jgi:hypothetical protein
MRTTALSLLAAGMLTACPPPSTDKTAEDDTSQEDSGQDTSTDTQEDTDSAEPVNNRPEAPEVVIEPTTPTPEDELVCRIGTAAVDADGDALTYAFAFFNDGDATPYLLADASESDTLAVPGDIAVEGETWRCDVTPHDGTEEGYVGRTSVVIGAAPCRDLNGDCLPDLVFSNSWDGVNYTLSSVVYWGSTSDYSGANQTLLPTVGAFGNTLADLDGDGHTDIVFANHTNGTEYAVNSYIYWGSETGPTANDRTPLPTLGAYDVAAHDLNLDGYLDLVFANAYNGVTYAVDSTIYWGSAAGFIASYNDTLPTLGAKGVATADLNGDTWPDIVFANGQDGGDYTIDSYIYWGDASGFSTTNRTDLPTQGANSVEIKDLNGDSHPDLVFANGVGDSGYDVDSYVYWGSASGYTESNRTGLATTGTWGLGIGDTDNDGHDDVVFASRFSGGYEIDSLIYRGDGSGFPHTAAGLPTSGAWDAAIDDLNADGMADLLFANRRSGSGGTQVDSQIYWGTTNGFTTTSRTPLPTMGAAGVSVAMP